MKLPSIPNTRGIVEPNVVDTLIPRREPSKRNIKMNSRSVDSSLTLCRKTTHSALQRNAAHAGCRQRHPSLGTETGREKLALSWKQDICKVGIEVAAIIDQNTR
jgi:hypothetical protein